MKNILVCIILFPFIAFELSAQNEVVMDSVLIDEVEITCIHLYKKPVVLDSILTLDPTKSVGDLLIEHSNVQLQQYGGKGAVQSLLIRGSSSSHNQVNWNGMVINSVTLGMFDFAGSSASSFDEVDIVMGGSAMEYGNGAIGGVVSMENKSSYNQGLKVTAGTNIGSFGAVSEIYGIDYSTKKFNYSLQYLDEFVKNDFTFYNRKQIGHPFQTQTDAEFWNTNITQEIHAVSNKVRFSSITWLNGKKKKSPKLLTDANPTQQFVADSAFRQVFKAITYNRLGSFTLQYGFSANRFRFVDYKTDNGTNYLIKEHFGKLVWNKRLGQTKLSAQSNNQFQNVQNTKYEGNPDRFISYSTFTIDSRFYRSVHLFATAGSQFSSINSKLIPVMALGYSLGGDHKRLLMKGSASSHYRLPSFNDLFWRGSGNDSLNAESGWALEQMIKIQNRNSLKSNLTFTAYNSRINNWIQWMPNGANWIPSNVKSVALYGMEVDGKLFHSFYNKVGWWLKASGAYTRTVIKESEIVDDPAIGNQAMHIPLFNGKLGSSLSWKGVTLNYDLSYFGKRYTTADNDPEYAMPSYVLSNASIHRKTKLGDHHCIIKGEVRNLLNTEYQVMSNYAMPGRAYYLTITLNLNFLKPVDELIIY